MIDFTALLKKLSPQDEVSGDPGFRLRTATVAAIGAADGTVDLTLSEGLVPDVAVLGGASVVVGTVVQVLSYRGALLVLGGSGAALSSPVELAGSLSNGGYASSTFGNTLTTTGIHGVAFIAPPSGRVQVVGRSVAGHATIAQFSLLDYEVRAGSTVGSGGVFRASSNITAGAIQSAVAANQGTIVTGGLVTGLTPGAVYNVALTYSSTGAGGSVYNRRHIAVYPA